MSDQPAKIAYFTPLQPVESGISQYSEDLLPWLATALDVAVVVDGYVPTLADALGPARIIDARRFDRGRYDATVLQMGNSPAHNYMVPLALAKPDVLVLHDVVLHHLMVWRAVQGRGGRDAYRREMRARYGNAAEEVAAHVLRGQNPTAMFDYPLNEDFLRAARHVVTHSPSAAAWVQRLVPDTRTHVVPMGVPIVPPVNQQAARDRLGLSPNAFVVLSLGRINPFKRIPAVFRAMRRLVDAVPEVQLLMVGGDSPHYDVPRLARFAGIERYVRRLGYVPDAQLPDLFAAADVCVELRYPTAGETSAAVLRLMSAGLPTIVTETGAFADLPDDAVLKVPPDAFEGETLVMYLRALAINPAFRHAVGANARDFVLREHTMRRAAEGYLDVLSEVLSRPLSHERIHEPPDRSEAAHDEKVANGPSPFLTPDPSRTEPSPIDWRIDRFVRRWRGEGMGVDPAQSSVLSPQSFVPIAEAIAELGLAAQPQVIAQTAQALADMHIGVPGSTRRRLRRVKA